MSNPTDRIRLPQPLQDFARVEKTKPGLLNAYTRASVEPMVRGLFPRKERDLVLRLLERCVVFFTPDYVEFILRLDGERPGEAAPRIVSLSKRTCLVSLSHLNGPHRFENFVVHEAAHVFHSCMRTTAGLPRMPRRRVLLDIDPPKRETFAYACEAFSRVVDLTPRLTDRPVLVEEFARTGMPINERVDNEELLSILREAARARNGWKRIRARCSRRRKSRAGHLTQAA